ncbi:MAG: (Fe-S)-binding protein [Deltaproteobacteria bacterium]|nr:(Fe-S)-binding protein [Deltaproteobacteria bacterium]
MRSELPGLDLAAHEKELLLCELCPRMCRHACPVGVVARDEALTPQEKMAEARRQLRGESEVGVHTAWDCAGCGLCTATCEHDNPVGELLLAARARRFVAGDAPEAARALARRCREEGTPRGPVDRRRLESIQEARRIRRTVREFEGPRVPGRGLRVLFPGCELVEDAPERVGRLLDIADSLGEGDLVVWDGAARCCGYPLLAAGDAAGYAAHASRLASALAGASLITTPCAHCATTLELASERFGIGFPPVEHLSQTLAKALRRKGVTRVVEDLLPRGWVLHEPCHLVHGLEESEAPRQLLEAITGGRPEAAEGTGESIWQGERSWCCGGGGALPHTRPELAREMARVRAADLLGESAGPPALEGLPGSARQLVTASPCCERHFWEAGVESEDLFELLGRFLEGGRSESREEG